MRKQSPRFFTASTIVERKFRSIAIIAMIAIFASSLSFLPSAISAPQDSSSLSRKLRTTLNAHKYKETIAQCNQVLRSQPSNFNAYLYRSEAELITDQRQKAIEDSGRASKLKLNPTYIKPYVIQSQSLLLADTHEEGIAECTELIEKDPLAPAPYFYRALFFLLTDRSRDAVVDLDRALARKPSIGLRAWIMGAKFSAHKSLSEYNAAMRCFRQAQTGLNKQIALCPEDLSVLYIRGVITHFADKPTSDFEKAVSGERGPVVEYLSRHVIAAKAIERKRYAEAEKLLEKNIALWPRHPSAYGLLAGCQTRRGRPDKAAETLTRITMLNPLLAGTYVTRLGYYHKIGKLPTFYCEPSAQDDR